MDGHRLSGWLEQALGFALIAFILLDVFLTVLYARMGTGILSRRLACVVWWNFRNVAKLLPGRNDTALTYCGPVILVLLVSIWMSVLTLGNGLVLQPKLGTSITANNGPTSRDLATAMYLGGNTMATAGASDMAPKTSFFRLYFIVTAMVGISVITLTLTYFLEVYNALQRRNTFALKMHLATAETGDSAELLAGLGPRGEFTPGYSQLAEMAAEVTALKESHHFYPVIFYFRFREPHYALSRVALLNLDLVTLVKSALADEPYAWFKESVAVAQLWRSSMHLLMLLAVGFLPSGLEQSQGDPDEQTLERWRNRYHAAVRRLRDAGIQTMADEEAGADNYIALRARWDRYICAFAEHMAHRLDEIDRIGDNPHSVTQRQPFDTRLRSAG